LLLPAQSPVWSGVEGHLAVRALRAAVVRGLLSLRVTRAVPEHWPWAAH